MRDIKDGLGLRCGGRRMEASALVLWTMLGAAEDVHREHGVSSGWSRPTIDPLNG